MNKLNKSLPSKYLLIIGIIGFVVGYFMGGIYGDGLRTLGFIIFVIGILALNRELKNKKGKKQDTNIPRQ